MGSWEDATVVGDDEGQSAADEMDADDDGGWCGNNDPGVEAMIVVNGGNQLNREMIKLTIELSRCEMTCWFYSRH